MEEDVLMHIVRGCQEGRREAQHKLYTHYRKLAFGICMRFADNEADGEDWLQEGFIKLFQGIGQFRFLGSFEGWLRRVFVHVALAQLKNKRKQHWLTAYSGEELEVVDDIDFSVFDEKDLPAALIQLLHQLPDGYRTILNLYVFEGFSHQEIASALGISVGTSKSQLNRAKAYLRSLIEKHMLVQVSHHKIFFNHG